MTLSDEPRLDAIALEIEATPWRGTSSTDARWLVAALRQERQLVEKMRDVLLDLLDSAHHEPSSTGRFCLACGFNWPCAQNDARALVESRAAASYSVSKEPQEQ